MSETVYIQPESCCGTALCNYTIRGRCSAEFFATTVNQFFNNYGAAIARKDAEAHELADAEWIAHFEAPHDLYNQLFTDPHRYVVAEVPKCCASEKSTDTGTRVLNLLSKQVSTVSYRRFYTASDGDAAPTLTVCGTKQIL